MVTPQPSRSTIFILTLTLCFSLSQSLNADNKVRHNPQHPQAKSKTHKKISSVAAGQIIVKFNDSSDIADFADILFEQKQSFESITGNKDLDVILNKSKARKMKKAFSFLTPQGVFSGSRINTQQIRDQRHALRQAYRNNISRLGGRKHNTKRKRKINPDQVPYLGSIYIVDIDPQIDVNEIISELNQNPAVAYAHPNYQMESYAVPNDPYWHSQASWQQEFDDLWGLKKMQMDAAWDIADGDGVIVAVVDSGIDWNHPDLGANIWQNPGEIAGNGIDDDGNGFVDDIRGWNFSSGLPGNNNPLDKFGHGTHVSGTIAAIGNNNIGIIGVAPKAKMMAVKGLDDSGNGSFANLAQAIVYAIKNGADVVNNSWGCSGRCPSIPEFKDVLDFADAMGTVLVFAAGNSSDDINYYSPQNSSHVITAAASTEIDRAAYFSNYGFVDVSAPGGGEKTAAPPFESFRNILSLKSSTINPVISKNGNLIVGSHYLRQAGTSMACPYVAGLAALIIQKHPEFTVNQVRQAIRKGAQDLGDPGYDTTFGYGRVNALQSLNITEPLGVNIDSPDNPELDLLTTLTVKATVEGPHLVTWILEKSNRYAAKPLSWKVLSGGTTPLQKTPITTLSDLVDGDTLRLRAVNRAGETYEDQQSYSFDGLSLSYPKEYLSTVKKSEEVITIQGTAAPALFKNYTMTVTDEQGSPISNANITLTNNGTQPVYKNVLGSWDTTGIVSGKYTLTVTAYTENDVISAYAYVIIDSTLHDGWPLNIVSQSDSPNMTIQDHFLTYDINSDQIEDLIIAYDHSLRIYDHTGAFSPGWPQNIESDDHAVTIKSAPAIGDLDHDGKPEIALLANSQNKIKIYVWHHDGSLLDSAPFDIPLLTDASAIAIDDMDNDGISEMIVTTQSGTVGVINAQGQFLPGWPKQLSTNALSAPAIGDMNHDGFKEIAVLETSPSIKIYILKNTGALEPHWPQEFEKPGNPYPNNPTLGNIDSDPDLELITIADKDAKIYVFKLDGSIVEGWPQKTPTSVSSTPIVGDINGDGFNEVIAPTYYNYDTASCDIYVWKGNGKLLKGWPVRMTEFPPQVYSFLSPSLADVNNNGKADLVMSPRNTNLLYAFDHTGKTISDFPKVMTSYTMINSPAISDIDGDGLLEIVYGDSEKNIYVWDTHSKAIRPRPWPMFAQNAQHTASAVIAPAISVHPQNSSIVEGESAHLSVSVKGTAPLEYQWKKNGKNIPSATQKSLTLSQVSADLDGTEYSVRIKNSAGTVYSKRATLSVSALPDLTATTLMSSQSAFPGNYFIFYYVITNNGAGCIAGPSTSGVYISKDTNITASDLKISSRQTPGNLCKGESNTEVIIAPIPVNINPGDYYIGVIADSLGEYRETNETNNVSQAQKIQIKQKLY